MFSQLVESDLHKGELKRKGAFFLATMAAYAVLLVLMGVGGVYAYQAQIDDQHLELVALIPPDTEEVKPRDVPPVRRVTSPPAPMQGDVRPGSTGGLIKNTPTNVSTDLTKIAGAARGETTQTPPIFSTGDRKLDPENYAALLNGPGRNTGNQTNATGGEGGEGILNEKPPEAKKKEEPRPQKERIPYVGPVTGRALSLPQPVYPPVARAAGIQGPVNVEVLIDESGRVLSAQSTSGHPLLRQEAERAAFRARFSPTLLQNQPVKVKGVITFNFVIGR